VLRPGGLFVTETYLNQFFSHPVRSWGQALPWEEAPALAPRGRTLMWEVRERR
jgi:hypothetical protein